MTLKEGDEQTTSSLYDDFHLVPVCVGAIELEEAIVLFFWLCLRQMVRIDARYSPVKL
jgi:hypothetical protein